MFVSNFRQCFRISTLRRTTCTSFFSSKTPQQGIVKQLDPETGQLKTKKTNVIPKITLVSGDAVTVTTLQDAEKISKRRDLKLVKVVDLDTKTQRPVYQLMTGSEYHAEDLKQREQRRKERQEQSIKGEKVLLINAKIAQHDLDTQLRKALKWLQKKYEVRVIISGVAGNLETSEKVFSSIEKYFNTEEFEARVVQKRCKGSDIKCHILPPNACNNKEDSL